jgi:hypothetical protein
MSSPNPMTREELLESAAMDAFGLLDEYEAALYTRSFHHAPAAVQREIIQLQADLVSDDTLLPTETPDPSLRERVLEAVAVAIEQETAELEPLATIGRNRAMPVEPVARVPLTASGQFWRAAVFVLCAGLIVVLYFLADVTQKHNQIAVLALQNITDAQLEQMVSPTGSVKDYLFDGTAKRVYFNPSSGGAGTRAALFINEASGEAFLVTEGLGASNQRPAYTLLIKDSAGAIDVVHKFASNGRISAAQFALDQTALQIKNAAWEIRDQTGTVLLASI